MKIAYLGAGAWGFCLASLLAKNGHNLMCWSINEQLVKDLNENKAHPNLPGHKRKKNMFFTTNLKEVLKDADVIVESVTSEGLRPVCEQLKNQLPECPFIITSKGIEQNSGLIMPEVVTKILGDTIKDRIGVISGPSFAKEVIKSLPTSVVATGYTKEMINITCDLFTNNTFRVYPNQDLKGVCFGGALKNVIAIACGIVEGLKLGLSARAALITRGLHEMRKLALASGAKFDTLNGLSGMGDTCLTCSSPKSRNFLYGELLARKYNSEEAQNEVGMVVEGLHTCVSALQLGQKSGIPMPITEIVYKIAYKGLPIELAIPTLMSRPIKEEHL